MLPNRLGLTSKQPFKTEVFPRSWNSSSCGKHLTPVRQWTSVMINWLAGQEHTLEPPPVRELPVVEIFGPTLQGEGSLVGQRTMFVRFGYCDGAGRSGWCRWCDSMEAVNPVNKDKWVSMTPQAIANALVAKSLKTGCRDVTFTGGNPLLHELDPLLYILSKDKEPWMKNVETQGTIFKPWLYGIDIVNVRSRSRQAGAQRNQSLSTRL